MHAGKVNSIYVNLRTPSTCEHSSTIVTIDDDETCILPGSLLTTTTVCSNFLEMEVWSDNESDSCGSHGAPIVDRTGGDIYGDITPLSLEFLAEADAKAPDPLTVVLKRFLPKSESEVGKDQIHCSRHARQFGAFMLDANAYVALSPVLNMAGLCIPRLRY